MCVHGVYLPCWLLLIVHPALWLQKAEELTRLLALLRKATAAATPTRHQQVEARFIMTYLRSNPVSMTDATCSQSLLVTC